MKHPSPAANRRDAGTSKRIWSYDRSTTQFYHASPDPATGTEARAALSDLARWVAFGGPAGRTIDWCLCQCRAMMRAGRNRNVFVVNVFRDGPLGGKPGTVVPAASEMTATAMRELAAHYEHASAFVLPGRDGCDLSLRFFVPN